jgi:hypothetical protein
MSNTDIAKIFYRHHLKEGTSIKDFIEITINILKLLTANSCKTSDELRALNHYIKEEIEKQQIETFDYFTSKGVPRLFDISRKIQE